jgi:hypothetical protein
MAAPGTDGTGSSGARGARDARDEPADERRPAPQPGGTFPFHLVPYVLLAMAGGCALSAGLGLAFALAGQRAPLALLLAPPVLVALAIAHWVRRGGGRP